MPPRIRPARGLQLRASRHPEERNPSPDPPPPLRRRPRLEPLCCFSRRCEAGGDHPGGSLGYRPEQAGLGARLRSSSLRSEARSRADSCESSAVAASPERHRRHLVPCQLAVEAQDQQEAIRSRIAQPPQPVFHLGSQHGSVCCAPLIAHRARIACTAAPFHGEERSERPRVGRAGRARCAGCIATGWGSPRQRSR